MSRNLIEAGNQFGNKYIKKADMCLVGQPCGVPAPYSARVLETLPSLDFPDFVRSFGVKEALASVLWNSCEPEINNRADSQKC